MRSTVECPWCDGPLELGDADANLVCDGCGVIAELAAEPPRDLAAAA